MGAEAAALLGASRSARPRRAASQPAPGALPVARGLTASHRWPALALAVVSVLAALVRPAIAADSHDVLIIGAGSPELMRKLRAETAYAGFHPTERASDSGAPATLRILSRERVELSVEGVDRKQRFEQTLVSRPNERDSFALRVVEQLRARLADVGWTLPEEAAPVSQAGSAPGSAAAPESVNGSANVSDAALGVTTGTSEAGVASARQGELFDLGTPDPSRSPDASSNAIVDGGDPSSAGSGTSAAGRLWLDAGIASSWASGGIGAMPHAALGAQLDLGAAWHARAASLWPLSEAQIEADEGKARAAWTGFTATLARSFAVPQPWFAQAGLGAGLLVLDARGEARDDFSGRRERLYAGTYFAEASFGRELASWLRLRASALGGVTAPRPVLRFDQREIASLGRFVGALTLGLDLTWPHAPEAP